MLGIIDYGLGNLFSLEKALKRLEVPYYIGSDHQKLKACNKFILPGVGHFQQGVEELNRRYLVQILNEEVIGNKKPMLGICLGMQLLTETSEESDSSAGLGFIKTTVKKLNVKEPLKVPHIGWNEVKVCENDLFRNIDQKEKFYFTHSYSVLDINDEFCSGTTTYGITFGSVIRKDHIYGVQFHPEKSLSQGLKLLQNFAAL